MVTANRPKIVRVSIGPQLDVFLAMPSVWKTAGLSSGHENVSDMTMVATAIMASVEEGGLVRERKNCFPIQSQAPAAIPSQVTQPWARSSSVSTPPTLATITVGKVNGSTQQAVQAAAVPAATIAALAACLRAGFGAQPQPGPLSEGRVQATGLFVTSM